MHIFNTNFSIRTKMLVLYGVGLCILFAISIFYSLQEKETTPNIWYVEKGLENSWAGILREIEAPEPFTEIRVWDGDTLPAGPGILIATKPQRNQKKLTTYYRLSYDLECEGAIVLAVDPWMVFRKQSDPALTADRVNSSGNGRDGVLLIPGKDSDSVRAWTARLNENDIFDTGIFPDGAHAYTWQDVFYRLMGNETAWVYAPLSAIRRYQNFRKSILTASPFPEPGVNRLQATLLWAVPLGSAQEREQIGQTIAWLKQPETQTVIADNLFWIPADPYGKPFDPVSMISHRNWLTTLYIYEVR